jgi:hypothetical protein
LLKLLLKKMKKLCSMWQSQNSLAKLNHSLENYQILLTKRHRKKKKLKAIFQIDSLLKVLTQIEKQMVQIGTTNEFHTLNKTALESTCTDI